ncbi:MAG: fused response regulator/phosphatase [Pseudomonadota bacterium]|nr:fused response regulator/phosphatase [Pseudomonadota bacterium]
MDDTPSQTGLSPADRGARILVVDDQPSSRALIGSLLKAEGYSRLAYAGDGVAAMDWLAENEADMIILDIRMPRMDGFEVCRAVRGRLGRTMPILVQTGVQEADSRVEAFRAGASDIVAKPVNAGELVSRVRLHLERRQMIHRLQRYQDRMEDELRAAQSMQLDLLPGPADIDAIVRPRGGSLTAFYRASHMLGGDLWQVFPVDETRFGIFMVDLSGHGVSAAINAFRVHMITAGLSAERHDPAQWLAALNRRLAPILPVEHFATAFYAVIDPGAGRLHYAAAGAPPPLLLRADGSWEALCGGGLILGCLADAAYETHAMDLSPGDRLFAYSDALCEDFEQPDRSLDAGEIAEAVQAEAGGGEAFADRLIARLFGRADPDFRDDLTFLLVGMTPS